MKRKLKRNALDKTNRVGEDAATLFDPKAEELMRGWMHNSSVSMEIPTATDKIIRQLQQAASRRSIRQRKRMVFWWGLISLVCGCYCIVILPNFMQNDIHLLLTKGVVQNHPYKITGKIDLPYWTLAFLAFIILGLLLELLLSSLNRVRSGCSTRLRSSTRIVDI